MYIALITSPFWQWTVAALVVAFLAGLYLMICPGPPDDFPPTGCLGSRSSSFA